MAQYQVPQFIEVEDKIFGPFTLRQFIWLAGGGGLSLIFFTLLPFILALPLIIMAMALGASLAFYKVNGRPLINAAEHAFAYFMGSKLYLWKQREAKPSAQVAAPTKKLGQAQFDTTQPGSMLTVPRLSQSKLKDLSWSLNIKEQNLYGRE